MRDVDADAEPGDAAPVGVLAVGDGHGPGPAVEVSPGVVADFAAALGSEAGDADPDGAVPATLVVALALRAAGGPADLVEPLVRRGAVGGVVHGGAAGALGAAGPGGRSAGVQLPGERVRRLPGALLATVGTTVRDSSAAGTVTDPADVAELTTTFVLADPAAARESP